jgi:aspartyl-tRNA(Asn)/glutamyl-tRNA(Gln) amidotransferase subunit B
LLSTWGLSDYDARILSSERSYAGYFEQMLACISQVDTKVAKMAANWFISELLGALNKLELDIGASPVSAKQLAGLIGRIVDDTISGKIAKQVLADMLAGEGDADAIIARKGLKQQTDAGAIEAIIKDVLAANPAMVDEYKSGKEKAFNGLVGQVMKASKGQANPAQVNQLLKSLLS